MKALESWLIQFRKIWEIRFAQLDKLLLITKKQKK